uniref:RGS domain-containing protein n=1 Tax=Photinus pyralis TaxID=7054 RepID=A0A1Y1LI36_PHOPY
MEICIESSNFGSGLVVALRPPFQRFNSSLRRGGSSRFGRRPASLLAPPDVVVQCDENGVKNTKQAEVVAAWATSFEKLLADSVGLQTFAEFLKKEFSAENIYFWTSCERYRRLPAGPEKVAEAQRIYKRHLCVGAPEAVNVDSQVRQFTEQSLQEAHSTLFEQTQKQIFNLMKFDSYPRFLKSDLYKQCLAGHIETFIDDRLLIHPAGLTPSKLKKSLSNAEDRWRKSLLPWHRKNRSKSKDRIENECAVKKDDGNESAIDEVSKNDISDVHSSKSSLVSQDSSKGLSEETSSNATVARGALCRVILNNGSTTVVKIKENETVEQMVLHVLEKRGITYSSFEVFTDKHHKSVSINEPSTVLAGCEVRVEQRVIFKLDLPNKKVIAVKSKSNKIIVDVLKPILNKYDYHLEQVSVTIKSDLVDVTLPVTAIDRMRLAIQLNNESKDPTRTQNPKPLQIKVFNASSLEEITNKVFKELLHEKADIKYKSGSDRGSVKSEDWGSEHSSGILGRFLRRDSGIHEKKKNSCRFKGTSNHSSIEDIADDHSAANIKKPLIAKWKTGVNKLHVGCSESDKLYEGLNRAQSSRIEDQRGTEINFELPDFLKDKDISQHNCSRVRKFRRTDGSHNERFCDPETGNELLSNRQFEPRCNYENRNVIFENDGGSNVNNNSVNHINQNTDLNNIRRFPTCTISSDESSKSSQSTPTKCNKDLSSNVADNPKVGDPPPLPPKPKILPIKPSNWGQSGLFKVPRVPRNDGTKQSLYLEQPTSSFV